MLYDRDQRRGNFHLNCMHGLRDIASEPQPLSGCSDGLASDVGDPFEGYLEHINQISRPISD
jgi:hypothetical protein